MPKVFWLCVCVVYCLWAAKGQRGSAVQGFLHGFFLGLFCFGVLPSVMKAPLFCGMASVCGTAAGVWLEEKQGRCFFPFAALLFTALTVFWLWQGEIGGSVRFAPFWAFLGGIGLYAVCCGILPEGGMEGKLRPAAGGCAGFLLSAAIFAAMGIF